MESGTNVDPRRLGSTDLFVTPIGFGSFKIGRNQGVKYPISYALPDDREVERLLNGVLDAGVNYIDTAPAYGLSEERIGRAIGHRRREYLLGTKVGEEFSDGESRYDFSAPAVRKSVERSLQRLKTEVLDIVLVHAHRDDVSILNQTDLVSELNAMKDRGLVRAIGFSGKTVEAARMALLWADLIMVEYHLDDTSHATVMDEASQRGIGVVVKKGLASGRLDPQEAIGHVLRNPSVTSLLIGTLSLSHLQDAVQCANRT